MKFYVLISIVLVACQSTQESLEHDLSDANQRNDVEVRDVLSEKKTEENKWPEVEELLGPAGAGATVELDEDEPFLQFIPELNLAELSKASQGRELFVAQWTPAVGVRPTLDGLGPLWIASSCVSCHPSTGRAPTLLDDGRVDVGILARLARPTELLEERKDPAYGNQLQSSGLQNVPAEGELRWKSVTVGQLEYPIFRIENLSYGNLDPQTQLGARIAPSLIGVGLIDAVDDELILEWADPNDENMDGISGRAHFISSNSENRVGRFGWKAIHSTLLSQSAGAFSGDMGLTTHLFPAPNCTDIQSNCKASISGGDPEVSEENLDHVISFLDALAVPAHRNPKSDGFILGRKIFHSIGCNGCHRETLTTRSITRLGVLNSQTFHPYSDLLLHNMGEDLADVKEGQASEQEWRSAPLWGLGFVMRDPQARLLHDGRARTITEAILWHDGESEPSRRKYLDLTQAESDALLHFLNSI